MPFLVESESQSGAPHEADREREPVFMMTSDASRLSAKGILQRLPQGEVATLAKRAAAFFAARESGPAVLVGAIPFDRAAHDYIFQPGSVSSAEINAEGHAWGPGRWRVREEPSVESFREGVRKAIALMTPPPKPLAKVVLSRSLVATAERAIDPFALAFRLQADPSAVRFVTPLDKGAALVGASPELLVAKTGEMVVSQPLAGSARRSAVASVDRERAEGLRRSEKDQREHAFVVQAILDALAPYCAELTAPGEAMLHSTRTMWHLGTRIAGRLKDSSVSCAELVAALHPTPAVGGAPTAPALQAIADIEGYDRGFYAGAVGWLDASGDGAWHVSLRCAEVDGRRLRIYAGAGIVPGSDAVAEADETSAKFQTLLQALGIGEDGAPLGPEAP